MAWFNNMPHPPTPHQLPPPLHRVQGGWVFGGVTTLENFSGEFLIFSKQKNNQS